MGNGSHIRWVNGSWVNSNDPLPALIPNPESFQRIESRVTRNSTRNSTWWFCSLIKAPIASAGSLWLLSFSFAYLSHSRQGTGYHTSHNHQVRWAPAGQWRGSICASPLWGTPLPRGSSSSVRSRSGRSLQINYWSDGTTDHLSQARHLQLLKRCADDAIFSSLSLSDGGLKTPRGSTTAV